jgi:hypothetical protein
MRHNGRVRTWLLLLVLFAACRKEPPAVAAQAPEGPPVFIEDSFEKLYPIFLLRKIKPGPKAALWTQYFGRWVKWTGLVRSITPNGITLKQINQTVTFDVSLWVDMPQQAHLREMIKIGDRVSYIGRLDSYDDVFRTMYLVHGHILETLPPPDAGN